MIKIKKEHKYKGKKCEVEYSLYKFGGMSLNYDDSLDKLHPDIKFKHAWIGDYEGDVVSIGYDSDGNWYYKNNSYGSCSGCDWVQGIEDVEGAEEFLKLQETLDELGKDKEKVKEYLTREVQNIYEFDQDKLDELIKFVDDV